MHDVVKKLYDLSTYFNKFIPGGKEKIAYHCNAGQTNIRHTNLC